MKDFQTKKMLYLNDLNCSISRLNKELANFPLQTRSILSCYFCLNSDEKMSEEQISEYLDIPLDTVNETISESINTLNQKIPSLNDKARLEYKIDNFFDMIEETTEVSILDFEGLQKEIESYIPYADLKKLMQKIKQQILDSGKIINEDRYDAERKNKLIRAYQENGDREALTKLIKMDERFIKKICSRHYANSMTKEDLFQEGIIGYMKALEKFDISKGYSLTTYATFWIRQHVNRQVAEQDSIIRRPFHIYEKINKLRRAVAAFTEKYNREPTIEEIAQELKLTVVQTKDILNASSEVKSLNEKLKDGRGKSDDKNELQDFIVDDNYQVAEKVEASLLSSEVAQLLDNSLLTSREKQVIVMRFGLDDGRRKTLEEVGTYFGITRERIRQLEAKALRKLRVPAKKMFKDTSDPQALMQYQRRKEKQQKPSIQNVSKQHPEALSTLESEIINELYGITKDAIDIQTIAEKRKMSKDKVAKIAKDALIKKGIFDKKYISKDDNDLYEYIKGPIIISNNFLEYIINDKKEFLLFFKCAYKTDNIRNKSVLDLSSDQRKILYKIAKEIRTLAVQTLLKANDPRNINELKNIYNMLATVNKNSNIKIKECTNIYDAIQVLTPTFTFDKKIIDYILDNLPNGMLKQLKARYGEDIKNSNSISPCSSMTNTNCYNCIRGINEELLDLYATVDDITDFEKIKLLYRKKYPKRFRGGSKDDLYDYMYDVEEQIYIPHELVDFAMEHMSLKQKLGVLEQYNKDYRTEEEKQMECKPVKTLFNSLAIVRNDLISVYSSADNREDIEALKQAYILVKSSSKKVDKSHNNKNVVNTSVAIYEYMRKDKISADVPNEFIAFVLENSTPNFLQLMYKVYGTENFNEMVEWKNVSAKEKNSFSSRSSVIRNEISVICEAAKGNYDLENLKRIYKERHPKKFKIEPAKDIKPFNLYDYCFEYPKDYVKYIINTLNDERKIKLQMYFGLDYENKIYLSDFSKKEERNISLLLLRFKKHLAELYSDYQKRQNTDESIYVLIKNGLEKYNVSNDFIDFILDNTDEKFTNMFIKAYGSDDYRNKKHIVIVNKNSQKAFSSYIRSLQELIESIYEKATENYTLENLKEIYNQLLEANNKVKKQFKSFNLFDKCSNFPKDYVIHMARSSKEPRKQFFIKLFGPDYENKISSKDLDRKQKEQLSQKLCYFNAYLAKHYDDYIQKLNADHSIYGLIKEGITEFDIADEFIDYILDNCKKRLIDLLKKMYSSEDYRNQNEISTIAPREKRQIKQYLNQIREDIISTYQLAGKDFSINNLRNIYNDKISTQEYLATNYKKNERFDLFDKYSQFPKEYVKYKADNSTPKKHENIVRYFGSNYDKKISYHDFVGKEQRSLYNLIYNFRKTLTEGYEEYIKITAKQEISQEEKEIQTQQLDPKVIKKQLSLIDDKYDYHEEIVELIIKNELNDEDRLDVNTMLRKLIIKIEPLYSQAKNPEDIDEIKRIYDFHYKVVKINDIKDVIGYDKKIENILLRSEITKVLLQYLDPLKVYATILSLPIVVGRVIAISTIAKILDISEEKCCQFILEGIEVIKKELYSSKNLLLNYERNISSEKNQRNKKKDLV